MAHWGLKILSGQNFIFQKKKKNEGKLSDPSKKYQCSEWLEERAGREDEGGGGKGKYSRRLVITSAGQRIGCAQRIGPRRTVLGQNAQAIDLVDIVVRGAQVA